MRQWKRDTKGPRAFARYFWQLAGRIESCRAVTFQRSARRLLLKALASDPG